MNREDSNTKCKRYLNKLCVQISERCVGSSGNKDTANYFRKKLQSFGWKTNLQKFKALDWISGDAKLQIKNNFYKVFVSPYSLDFDGSAILESVTNISQLNKGNFNKKILLIYGELAKEQLMPKNFVFYNPEEHKKIISSLEEAAPLAIICITGRNPELTGGVYPFPLIEDGDFNIPSVYMTEEEGNKILSYVGREISLTIPSKRIPSNGCNVIGTIGNKNGKRIVITAHIDSKKGTPGATDNATGITILLLLAEMFKDYKGDRTIEIVALNGEDYYAVSGQMTYINENKGLFENILLNINIDGAGYIKGKSTFSFFDLSEKLKKNILNTLKKYPDIKEGIKWPQGDHSIFLQYGVPALAISSEWFTEKAESQNITHTDKDNIKIVDYTKIIEIAEVLYKLIKEI